MDYIITADDVLLERDSINPVQAGNSQLNYFLKGLSYKITIRTTNTTSVKLYPSETFDSFTNSFDFTDEGNGVFTYEEVAGENATASSNDFTDGIKFYFRFELINELGTELIDRLFWVRDPENIIVFESEQMEYRLDRPVMIGALSVPIGFALDAKNGAGELKRGGIATVEVFTDPAALSTGSHVNAVAETAVGSVTSITLVDRTLGSKIPDFIPAPGNTDYSNYYHFITVRLRSKSGSSNFRDINVILFGSRKCKNSTYGYDSSGEVDPAPTPSSFTTKPGPPPEVPPPTCSSKSYVCTVSGIFNVYASTIIVEFYADSGLTDFITKGEASVVSTDIIEVKRTDLEDGLSDSVNISGYVKVEETGPDRTGLQDTPFITTVYQCNDIPVDTPDIPDNTPDGDITINIPDTGRPFDPTKTYTIDIFPTLDTTGTPDVTLDATYVDDFNISATITETTTGIWVIVEDGRQISEPQEHTTSVSCSCSATSDMLLSPALVSSSSTVISSETLTKLPFLTNNRCRWLKNVPGDYQISLAWLASNTWDLVVLDLVTFQILGRYDGPSTEDPDGVYPKYLPAAGGTATISNTTGCPDGEGP